MSYTTSDYNIHLLQNLQNDHHLGYLILVLVYSHKMHTRELYIAWAGAKANRRLPMHAWMSSTIIDS